ncbi:MAG: GNAT family N-acetyltransferase [Flagellimonas sp.]
MNSWLYPLQLEGESVKLVPLQKSQKVDLAFAASDGNLWELWYTSVPSPKTIDAYLDMALSEQEQGNALPFAVINKKTNTIVGSTRFLNIDAKNKRVEIGATWYAKKVQRTGNQYGVQVPIAKVCLRKSELYRRGIQNTLSQPPLPQRNTSFRCQTRWYFKKSSC